MRPKKHVFSPWYLQRVKLWDKLIAQGLSYQEIADRTQDVTARTVEDNLKMYWKCYSDQSENNPQQ